MPEWLMLLNMEGTLGRYSDSDFSETARSDPGHGEAGRHRVRLRRLLAEARRRSTHGVSEGTAERADAGETDGEADIGHAAVGVAEQGHGPFHPPALQVAVGRLAEGGPEGADEVGLGDERDPGKRGDVQRPRVVAVDGVASSQHPPVALLVRPGRDRRN